MNDTVKKETVIASVFKEVATHASEEGLTKLKAVLNDKEALREFLDDTENTVSVLDALYDADKELFAQALSSGHITIGLLKYKDGEKHAEWLTQKLEGLDNETKKKIINSTNASGGIVAAIGDNGQSEWVVNQFRKNPDIFKP